MTSGWRQQGKSLVGLPSRQKDRRPQKQGVSIVTFCHGLADPDDAEERDRALNALPVFLAKSMLFTEENCRALWRGLWLCHWHSDRPLVQIDNANRISKLLQHIPRGAEETTGISKRLVWSASFWAQSVEEWPKLDFYRIDKFLTLFRLMLYETFLVLKEDTTTALDINFFNRSMLTAFTGNTIGVAFQLCDCWVPEALHAELPRDLLTRTLHVFVRWLAGSEAINPALAQRVWSNVFNNDLLGRPRLYNRLMLEELMRSEKEAAKAELHSTSGQKGLATLMKKIKEYQGITKKKKRIKVEYVGDGDDFGFSYKYDLMNANKKNNKKKKAPKVTAKSDKKAKAREKKQKLEERMKKHPKQFKNQAKLTVKDFAKMEFDDNDYD